MNGLHAHWTSAARDCDGLYEQGGVYEMTTLEQGDDLAAYSFKTRVLASTVNLAGSGVLNVTEDGLTWSEATDEGYRAANVRWCEDECDDERTWQRDHTAERAGY